MSYQGSDKAGVEATFYARGSDPVLGLQGFKGPLLIAGLTNQEDDASLNGKSAIVNATWTKTIGGGAGRWNLSIKSRKPEIFRKGLQDDDWIDLTFLQHDRRFLTCRGMIDTIRGPRSVNNGATTTTWTISGRDHTKPFEVTDVFFNRFIGENVGGGATLRAWINSNEGREIWGNVDATVYAFLFEFLRQLGQGSNARWELPPGIPNTPFTYFLDALRKQSDYFTNRPERIAVRPFFLDCDSWTGHNLWQLAREWSDPAFCELWCDIIRSDNNLLGVDEELTSENAAMAVILRDRPFPTGVNGPVIESPWFQLPMHIVQNTELGNTDEGRGGEERYNAFFLRSSTEAEFSNSNIDITKPIWDPKDIAYRGIRRMDISSSYVSPYMDNIGMVTDQRARLRDWYGLNPYFLNGTLPLVRLRPDIRLGSRVRIPGASPEEDVTYYVEGITHNWSLGRGRTTLTVTRGWEGTDQSLAKAVAALETRYTTPSFIVRDDTVNTAVIG